MTISRSRVLCEITLLSLAAIGRNSRCPSPRRPWRRPGPGVPGCPVRFPACAASTPVRRRPPAAAGPCAGTGPAVLPPAIPGPAGPGGGRCCSPRRSAGSARGGRCAAAARPSARA
ncbi:hypothetical protein G6F57_022265 [Rhizopus arrhizus]|nr:hypothetical protein G6F57_022265 [Rhizopus arrhizus]